MYDDPRHIKRNVYKVCLTDEQAEAIDRLARAQGKQRSTFLRELIVELVHMLDGEGTNNEMKGQNDGPKKAQQGSKAA